MTRGQKPSRVHVESILFSQLPVSVRTAPDVAPTGVVSGIFNRRVLCSLAVVAVVVTAVLVSVYVLDEVETADSDIEDLSRVPYPPSAPPFASPIDVSSGPAS